MSKNGSTVSAFERELASYCWARYAIAASNGTVTLQAALVALGIKPGDRVATTPLTMSATTIAILNVGAVPVYCDVDPKTWLMQDLDHRDWSDPDAVLPVSLYGLHQPFAGRYVVDDAAQTLRKHNGCGFTSLSMQASKILSLGEGGALLTNDEELASRARSYLSLGYKMSATQARIDSAVIKSPSFERHHLAISINGRMNDLTAAEGLTWFSDRNLLGEKEPRIAKAKRERQSCASLYRDAITGCEWLTPQHQPQGWNHSYWAFAVACDTPQRAVALQAKMGELGAEVPYGAWRLTYHEPAFREIGNALTDVDDWAPDASPLGVCPIAENLQPRILAMQTNSLESAERNATALRRAIQEIG